MTANRIGCIYLLGSFFYMRIEIQTWIDSGWGWDEIAAEAAILGWSKLQTLKTYNELILKLPA